MIGKQNRDTLYFGGWWEGWSVLKCTGLYSRGGPVMECEYIRSLTIFLLFSFAWKYADFTDT